MHCLAMLQNCFTWILVLGYLKNIFVRGTAEQKAFLFLCSFAHASGIYVIDLRIYVCNIPGR